MNIFSFISATEGCTLFVAALAPDLLVAIGTATGVIVSKFKHSTPQSHEFEVLFT